LSLDCLAYNQFLNIINFSISAFEISLGTDEEICITQQNSTGEKCALKPELQEIKNSLLAMKNQISKLNDEVAEVNERFIEKEACKKGMEFVEIKNITIILRNYIITCYCLHINRTFSAT
jgi:cell division protein FtsB